MDRDDSDSGGNQGPGAGPGLASRAPGRSIRLGGLTLGELLASSPDRGRLRTVDVAAGIPVFEAGETGDTAYLILGGSISIEGVGPLGNRRQLAALAEGDLFGEMAILDDPRRSATARAGEAGARLLAIPKATLEPLFAARPEVARWMLKVLSHRLRVMTKMSSEMEQIQEVSHRIITSQADERRRMARDLHDGPAQYFADYVMRLGFIEKLLDRDPARARTEIAELKKNIGQGLDKLRALMHGLHDRGVRTSGLKVAVQKLVERLGETAGFAVELDFVEGLVERLPEDLQTTIYCLVQEAANNAKKHARAKTVRVRLGEPSPGTCRLAVEDDGVGFDLDAVLGRYHERESLGMTSMQERAQLAGGRLEVASAPGRGTTLSFLFPFERKEAPP